MNKFTAIFLAAGLVVGIFVGYGMGARRVSEVSSSARAEQNSSASHPDKAGGRSAEGSVEPVGIQEPAKTEDVPGEQSVGSIVGVDAVVEAGVGVIRGRVTFTDGQPVKGAVVRVIAQTEADEELFEVRDLNPEDVESMIGRYRDFLHAKVSSVGRVVTDDQGFYEIGGLIEQPYRVWAESDGYQVRSSQNSWEVEPDATVNFIARRTFVVPVSVTIDGVSVEEGSEVSVNVDSSTGVSGHGWTFEERWIEVGEGVFEIMAYGDGGVITSEPFTFRVEADAIPESITLNLEREPGVYGNIVIPEGVEVSEVVLFWSQEPCASVSKSSFLENAQRTTVSEWEKWNFALQNLESGQVTVGVGYMYNAVDEMKTIQYNDAPETMEIELPGPTEQNSIRVRALSPAGVPLLGFTVETGTYGHVDASGNMEDGWRVEMHGGWGPNETEKDIHVMSSAYGAVTKTIRPGDKEVTVQFEDPAELEVTIQGFSTDTAGERLTISLSSDKMYVYEERSRGSGLTRDGVGVFGPFQPGSLEVILTIRSNWGNESILSRTPCTVGPGRNQVSVPIPTMYSLTVVVPGGVEDAMMICSFAGGYRYAGERATLDNSGTAVFENLVPGTYDLRMEGQKNASEVMRIKVPGMSSIQFEPRVLNAYRVFLNEESPESLTVGPLKAGDLIVGADGSPIETARAFSLYFRQLVEIGKDRMDLTIRRQGEEHVVSVRCEWLKNAFDWDAIKADFQD